MEEINNKIDLILSKFSKIDEEISILKQAISASETKLSPSDTKLESILQQSKDSKDDETHKVGVNISEESNKSFNRFGLIKMSDNGACAVNAIMLALEFQGLRSRTFSKIRKDLIKIIKSYELLDILKTNKDDIKSIKDYSNQLFDSSSKNYYLSHYEISLLSQYYGLNIILFTTMMQPFYHFYGKRDGKVNFLWNSREDSFHMDMLVLKNDSRFVTARMSGCDIDRNYKGKAITGPELSKILYNNEELESMFYGNNNQIEHDEKEENVNRELQFEEIYADNKEVNKNDKTKEVKNPAWVDDHNKRLKNLPKERRNSIELLAESKRRDDALRTPGKEFKSYFGFTIPATNVNIFKERLNPRRVSKRHEKYEKSAEKEPDKSGSKDSKGNNSKKKQPKENENKNNSKGGIKIANKGNNVVPDNDPSDSSSSSDSSISSKSHASKDGNVNKEPVKKESKDDDSDNESHDSQDSFKQFTQGHDGEEHTESKTTKGNVTYIISKNIEPTKLGLTLKLKEDGTLDFIEVVEFLEKVVEFRSRKEYKQTPYKIRELIDKFVASYIFNANMTRPWIRKSWKKSYGKYPRFVEQVFVMSDRALRSMLLYAASPTDLVEGNRLLRRIEVFEYKSQKEKLNGYFNAFNFHEYQQVITSYLNRFRSVYDYLCAYGKEPAAIPPIWNKSQDPKKFDQGAINIIIDTLKTNSNHIVSGLYSQLNVSHKKAVQNYDSLTHFVDFVLHALVELGDLFNHTKQQLKFLRPPIPYDKTPKVSMITRSSNFEADHDPDFDREFAKLSWEDYSDYDDEDEIPSRDRYMKLEGTKTLYEPKPRPLLPGSSKRDTKTQPCFKMGNCPYVNNPEKCEYSHDDKVYAKLYEDMGIYIQRLKETQAQKAPNVLKVIEEFLTKLNNGEEVPEELSKIDSGDLHKLMVILNRMTPATAKTYVHGTETDSGDENTGRLR
jgi:hypothetical protein